jgi:hypothetical protein
LTDAVTCWKSAVDRFCALTRRRTSRVREPPPSLIAQIPYDAIKMPAASNGIDDGGVY